jgi:anaerobic magnesium-protoporphyrin IX monomethyl ester cyclase
MRIALIQCPSWTTESPPYALGILAAILRKSGQDVACFDFNIETFKYCQEITAIQSGGINGESWFMDQRGNIWYEKDKVADFVHKHKEFIGVLINSVLDYQPQVIGFSVQSTSKFFSLALAALLKQKQSNAHIIFGGPLVFRNCYGIDILKDYFFLDAISFAEADDSFPKFLQYREQHGGLAAIPGFAVRLNSGEILMGENPPVVDNLNFLPYADYSDFSFGKYTKKLIPITTSRGCINRCSFCSESIHWRKYRRRSAQNIVDEMMFQLKRYPHVNQFWFNDSLINGDMQVLDELCDLIINQKLAIKWGGQGMIRKEMTSDFLLKMKRAGCYVISYGVESGSNKILGLMRKGYTAKLAQKVIRDTYDAGIGVVFNIMTGFPGEDETSFNETKGFILRCRKYASHIELPVYLLLKGSYIFDNLEEFNIAPINYNEDWQLKWKTKDNINTYEARQNRWFELHELLKRS